VKLSADEHALFRMKYGDTKRALKKQHEAKKALEDDAAAKRSQEAETLLQLKLRQANPSRVAEVGRGGRRRTISQYQQAMRSRNKR
jgi:hypothetical protein